LLLNHDVAQYKTLCYLIVKYRLGGEGGPSGYDSGYSGRDSEASSGTANPDLQASVPVILQHLEAGRTAQQQLLSLWAHKKARLDQCFQLRLFEQDCDKVNLFFLSV
jgi:triple functional domain protein